jgi:phage N-6-adenine-methyltransferase
MKTGASFARGQSRQTYATPKDFINAVVNRFGSLGFDLAADAQNTKAKRYYTEADNSLIQPWHCIEVRGALFLNPPFDNIAPWAEKCAYEARLGAKILFLTPASVGSNWFADYVHQKALVLALTGRLCFDPLHPKWGYPKDCILSCYNIEQINFGVWRWKNQ